MSDFRLRSRGQRREAFLRTPVAVAALTAAWEVVVGAGFVLSTVAAKPTVRRLEQIGDALDRLLGQSISRYGNRYRRWVMSSRSTLSPG